MLIKCLEEECNESFTRKWAFIIHLRAEHKKDVEIEDIKFSTLRDYKEWFVNNVGHRYMKKTVSKYHNNSRFYYECITNIKECTSYATIVINPKGIVDVKFVRTHYGHDELENEISVEEYICTEDGQSSILLTSLTESSLHFENTNIRCLEGCEQFFRSKSGLISHLVDIHNMPFEECNLNFSTITEFYHWLNKEKEENNVDYIRGSGKKKSKKATVVYYDCARSGKIRQKVTGERKRKLKSQGYKKINSTCTSQIKVKVMVEGDVYVRYTKTHYGHLNEVQHLPSLSNNQDKQMNKLIKVVCGEEAVENAHVTQSHEICTSLYYVTLENDVGPSTWIVGNTETNETYQIVKYGDNPCCLSKCDKCNICIHCYDCTCSNFLTQQTVCKHIHYLHTSLDNINTTMETITSEILHQDMGILCHNTSLSLSNEAITIDELRNKVIDEASTLLPTVVQKLKSTNDSSRINTIHKYLSNISALCDEEPSPEKLLIKTREPYLKNIPKERQFFIETYNSDGLKFVI